MTDTNKITEIMARAVRLMHTDMDSPDEMMQHKWKKIEGLSGLRCCRCGDFIYAWQLA